MRNKQKEYRVKDQNSFFKKFDAVFYDVYEHSKKYNHHILSRLSHVPKFSINHGLKPRFIVSQKNYDEDSLPARSEEHTSELQSRGHLVCRLLLEKKKK